MTHDGQNAMLSVVRSVSRIDTERRMPEQKIFHV